MTHGLQPTRLLQPRDFSGKSTGVGYHCPLQFEMVVLYQIHNNSFNASLVTQPVKNLLAVQETQVLSLGWEDPLEKEMANLSSIRAWKTPFTEESGWLQSMGLQRVKHN